MKSSATRRDVLSWSAALAFASSLGLWKHSAGAPVRSTRPNILFIVADDLGYADLSCYGRRDYATPVLDALATSGIALSQGYANSSVCSATRTALITGAYQYRLRAGLEEPIATDPLIGLPPGTPTLPTLLKELGYSTSLIGKWHLGPLPRFGPLKSGYDRFFGVYEGGADYFDHKLYYNGQVMGGLFEGERPIERQGYMTNLLAERAMAEIREASARSKPFFMSLHFTAPHWPWQGPEDRAAPAHKADSQEWNRGNVATYGRIVKSLDENIGKVLTTLEDVGLADDTIVVFTSDNGGERFSDTWPFIGAKTELLEGGIRVPLIVRWAGRIKPGTRSDQVMISMDFLPTLYAAAGGRLDARVRIDGVNVLDVLTGNAPVIPRTLFWRYKAREQRAVRSGDWKYLRIDGKEHLFNIVEDQRERADLKNDHPDIFARLKVEFEAWNKTMLPYPPESLSSWTPSKFADR